MAEIIDLTCEPDRTVERKERRPLEIANSRAKDSIYWKVFMTILCLLNTDLCNEEELSFINKFKDEYNAATQYLYIRLFLRRRNKYHSIESINYDGFTSELTLSCLKRLSDDGLLISEVGSSLHDVLILLNSDALRELCKSLRIPTSTNNTKERMIAELKEQAKREAKAQKLFGIRKADGTAKVCKVQEKARKLLGHVFKLNEKYFEIIQRFHLSYFCFTEWKEESFLVDELLTQFQKKSFPEYEFDNYFVFQNRQELLDYEYALKAEYALVKFYEEKNYADAHEIVKKYLQEAKNCLNKEEPVFTEELTEFVKVLRGWFSAKSVWMRFLRLSCEVYAKLKLREEEFMLLKILLYTPRFVGSTLSRGRLWDRLALVCERYVPLKMLQEFYPGDNSPETQQEQDDVIILIDDDDDFVDDFVIEDSKSKGRKVRTKMTSATDADRVLRRSITLKVLEEALNDESVSASRRICLEQRKARIEHSFLDAKERKRKRQESEAANDSVKDSYSDEENDAVPSVIFGQKAVTGSASGSRKSMWFLETGDNSTGGDVLHVTVEERVLLEYSQKGWTGYHAEGSLFSTLFSLLFHDILFISDVPGAFIHGFQVAPMDLSTEWFYLNRKNEIDDRLDKMNDIKAAVQLLQTTFDSIVEKQPSCVGLSWDYPIDHLKDLCLCLGSGRLKKVMQKFATNYRNSRSGLPDLTVWKPGTELVRMIEVKGPGDRLRSHQELWKNALNEIGIPTEVCQVRDRK
jgi:Fanconi-associated nuclease 1